MQYPHSESSPNLMNNNLGSTQMIKFPTITKLMYDGDNSHQIKNTFKSTNSKLSSKNSINFLQTTLNSLIQTNSFRLVEVPPDNHVMRISMMNISNPIAKQMGQTQQYESIPSRIGEKLVSKDRSSSILANNVSPFSRKTSLITINRTAQNTINDKNEQNEQKNKNKTYSVLKKKPKIDFKIIKSKQNINEVYIQIISALALVNGNVLISQGKNFQRIRRAKIEKGNNGFIVKQMIKKRTWWNTTQETADANMIWTEKSIENVKICDKFYADSVEKEDQVITFQRNIDKILLQFPKIIQLFFTEQQLLKQANESVKLKRLSQLYYMLGTLKASRKIFPEKVVIYNHIPNNFQICSKKMLYKNMWNYFHENGKDPYLYIPKTYHLTAFDWQQKIEFVKEEHKAGKKQLKQQQAWFLKPGQNTNRGKGIQMFKSTSEALDYIIRNPPKSMNKTYILQKYINPLLYNSRKFDIRCYMLCIQVFQVQTFYWYEEGYIRTSSQKFTMNKTSISIHLTNDAVQKQFQNYDKYESANKLSYLEIDKYIKNEYGFDFFNIILKKMKSITTDICKAAGQMGQFKSKQSNGNSDQQQDQNNLAKNQSEGLYFEVFGLDFIISNEGDPYLLEVNTNPCLQINSNVLSRIIPQMLQNTFRIVNDVYMPNRTMGSGSACPDWGQNFLQNNKYSLLYRRKLNNENEGQNSKVEKDQETQR